MNFFLPIKWHWDTGTEYRLKGSGASLTPLSHWRPQSPLYRLTHPCSSPVSHRYLFHCLRKGNQDDFSVYLAKSGVCACSCMGCVYEGVKKGLTRTERQTITTRPWTTDNTIQEYNRGPPMSQLKFVSFAVLVLIYGMLFPYCCIYHCQLLFYETQSRHMECK